MCYIFLCIYVLTYAIIGTQFYVPVLILLTKDDAKLFGELKSGFKRTIKWNKYQSRLILQAQDPYQAWMGIN